MRFQAERKGSANLLDITPIVDTVFNLLIFFALSLNFISTPGIQVNLPKSSAQEIAKDKQDLRVIIRPSGEIFLGATRVNAQNLAAQFRQAAQANSNTQVLIQADEQVSHGKVVEVMDFARKAGLHRLAIVTRPKDS
ncbi:MAG: biopolymer transporter ExbD [Deltaproteobacteria bacterium]|nr:biopolymer transporter ExbD [Deltaproteobacteria bacterium]